MPALRWAATQASLTQASLEAVTTWRFPTSYGFPVMPDVDLSRDVTKVLEVTLTEVLGEEAAYVGQRTVEGHPARVLLDAAKGAELLVVGSRGHGGFTGLLLGSISEYVVTHAPCPVVVVREPAAGSAD